MDSKNSKNVVKKKNTLQRTLRINQWTVINLTFLEHWTKCNLKLLSVPEQFLDSQPKK